MIMLELKKTYMMFGLKFKEKFCLQKTERARVQEVLRLLRIGVPIMTVSKIVSGGCLNTHRIFLEFAITSSVKCRRKGEFGE